MTEPSSKRQKIAENGGAKKTQFTCQLCNKSYDRNDHLARHLDSHRDERLFRCTDCPRGFNRRDLLLRHQTTHLPNNGKTKAKPDRAKERAVRACDACVLSKLKCCNTRPCKRCFERGIECSTQSLNQRRSFSYRSEDAQMSSNEGLRTPESNSNQAQLPSAGLEEQIEFMPSSDNQISWPNTTLDGDIFDFPSFFEHIMDPDPNFGLGTSLVQAPPELSTLMPNNAWFDTDLFGLEFTPTVDQAVGTSNYGFPDLNSEVAAPSVKDASSSAAETAGRRHAIYEQSHWLWKPDSTEKAFSGDDHIPLDERTVDTATSPQPRLLPSLAMTDALSAHKRDTIFHVIIKVSHQHLSIPSFPSAKCLDILLKVGIALKAERDAWFHASSFSIESARPELLIALIAAGCVCFNVANISRTGLVLFEVAQVALARLFEDDNSVIRDLQYLQASMSWLDTCAFCGFTRKMEIAESNLQPLVTALRRFGKFDRVAYPHIRLEAADTGEALERKWRQWAEQESFKRLVHHVFKHDMYMTTTKVRNPLVSYAEMNLPLPDSRELWLAPTAEAWKSLYVSKQQHTTSVCDLLANNDLIKCLSDSVDIRLARKAYVHGLAALTWEHSQQEKLFNSVDTSTNPSAKLWLQTRYQTLYDTLKTFRASVPTDSPSLRMLLEFLMLNYHVVPDTVTRFAGKCGEEEAHRAFQELQLWIQTKQARLAVWHGAQVLRAARTVRPHHLRGGDSFIIHHTVMVMWAYSMLLRDAARKAGLSTPLNGGSGAPALLLDESSNEPLVMLDGDSDSGVDSFILGNTHRPYVLFDAAEAADAVLQGRQPRLCDLRHPQQVLKMGVRVLEGSFPNEPRHQLPPLIKSLCDLMDMLASLR